MKLHFPWKTTNKHNIKRQTDKHQGQRNDHSPSPLNFLFFVNFYKAPQFLILLYLSFALAILPQKRTKNIKNISVWNLQHFTCVPQLPSVHSCQLGKVRCRSHWSASATLSMLDPPWDASRISCCCPVSRRPCTFGSAGSRPFLVQVPAPVTGPWDPVDAVSGLLGCICSGPHMSPQS